MTAARARVVTVSDRSASGAREDTSGPLLARLLGIAPRPNDGDATLIDETLAPAAGKGGQ